MTTPETALSWWKTLSPDGRLLFLTRFTRLFAYGFLAVVLMLYLVEVGLTATEVGLLVALTLVGDTIISLFLTTSADRFGRRHTLLVGAALMFAAGIVFALTGNFLLLLLAATIGVISPSGNEIGPFLSIEQAALTQSIPPTLRTKIFTWYNLIGSLATALGSLCVGYFTQILQFNGWTKLQSYQAAILVYAALGAVLMLLFLFLSPASEVTNAPSTSANVKRLFGLHRSRKIVFLLSCLFAIDAFGGGFVIQSFVAFWFHKRFGMDEATLGTVFFAANLLAGLSALLASWVAQHIGLLRTMVFTHLPSNILLILVPLMPNWYLAITMLLLRFSISQMDVPTRQSYTMAVVDPDERSAASGITGVARSVGAALAPFLAAPLLGSVAWISVPFFIAGGMKIIYDLLLYRAFIHLKPPEEKPLTPATSELQNLKSNT